MTIINNQEYTRTNRDLVIFCIVTAIIVGTISTTFTLHFMHNHVDQQQQEQLNRAQEHLSRLEQRLDVVEQKQYHTAIIKRN